METQDTLLLYEPHRFVFALQGASFIRQTRQMRQIQLYGNPRYIAVCMSRIDMCLHCKGQVLYDRYNYMETRLKGKVFLFLSFKGNWIGKTKILEFYLYLCHLCYCISLQHFFRHFFLHYKKQGSLMYVTILGDWCANKAPFFLKKNWSKSVFCSNQKKIFRDVLLKICNF